MGWYTRNATELVLLGKRGKRLHREDMNVHQIISSAISNHSKKPDEVRNRIVKLCGNVPRIELFARDRADGWDVWGNEAPNFTQLSLPSADGDIIADKQNPQEVDNTKK